MSKKTAPDYPPQIYVLRVSITGIKPQIWRELSVPGNYTLKDLHRILQIAFGWEEEHLHSFTVNETQYGMAEMIDMDVNGDFDTMVNEATVCLSGLRLLPKQKFTYLYDFGDSWEHEITVSKIIPVDGETEDPPRPRCLGGKRAGPPEDSGGVWGYGEMLEILKDPTHKEYEETREWAGDIDPEYISLEKINSYLEQSFKPPAPKAGKKGKSKSKE
jgi:hypothetical protein